MKRHVVRRLPFASTATLSEVGALVDRECESIRVAETPWPDFPYRPEVTVGIGYAGGAVVMRYHVREERVLALKVNSNEAVSEDSCVELFIQPAESSDYYNFEFNCIGTCLLGIGPQRHGRRLVSPEIIATIRRESSLGSMPFEEREAPREWQLTALIALGELTGVGDLSGRTMRANFYKCGDHLNRPHYLTWSFVSAAKPDFHRPESFGEIVFEG